MRSIHESQWIYGKCAIVRNLFEKKTKHLALAFLKKKKKKVLTIMNGLLNFKWNNGKVLFLKQLFSFCFHWNNSAFEYRSAMNMNLQRHFVCRILEISNVHSIRMFNSTCKNLLFQFHLKKFCTEQFYCKPTLNGALRIDLVQL